MYIHAYTHIFWIRIFMLPDVTVRIVCNIALFLLELNEIWKILTSGLDKASSIFTADNTKIQNVQNSI